MPELRLQGASDVCIVSWTSDIIDIHRLHYLIGEKGWQLTNLQFPSGYVYLGDFQAPCI